MSDKASPILLFNPSLSIFPSPLSPSRPGNSGGGDGGGAGGGDDGDPESDRRKKQLEGTHCCLFQLCIYSYLHLN